MPLFRRLIHSISSSYHQVTEASRTKVMTVNYRVVSLEQDKHKDYVATVQVVNKNTIFKMKPEEILADDSMTDQFSPRDIRALTYLGYLGINSPKYTILAKKLSEQNDHMVFALHRKGSSNVEIKTAEEISSDQEILNGLDQKDAHVVGFTTGSQQILQEETQKAQIKAKKASQ